MIYFVNFMNFDFIFNFFLFQRKKIYTLKLIVALNFSLLRQVFFPSSLRRISIPGMWVAWLTQFADKWFFQSPFDANEMFCLPNKFVLVTNHKQPLNFAWQNSYLDWWSNTLYIIWQGVHLLVKLQARGTNK